MYESDRSLLKFDKSNPGGGWWANKLTLLATDCVTKSSR